MPSEIDAAARLDEIARATLEVAREQGTRAVTIRAVATQMGGSTTLITKFVASRAVLLLNAMRYVRRGWGADLADALHGHEGVERAHALADWMCDTVKYDDVIRRQWVEMISTEDEGSQALIDIREEAREELVTIEEALAGSGLEKAPWLTDLLYLAFRGYYVSTVEDPSRWPASRAQAAVNGLLADLAPAPARRKRRSAGKA